MDVGTILRWLLEVLAASAGPTLRTGLAPLGALDEAIELTVSGRRFRIVVEDLG